MDLQRRKVAVLPLLAAVVALTAANSTLPPGQLWDELSQVLMLATDLKTTEPTEVINDWVTEEWFTARDKPNPRCPTLDPSIPDFCADLCVGDLSCPEGKVCCRNNCGGTECMDPISKEIPAMDETPMTTDPPNEAQTTEIGMTEPTDVMYDWMMDEFYITRDKPNSRCPTLDLIIPGVCIDMCFGDWSCPHGKVCCPNTCGGTECTDPISKEIAALDETPTPTEPPKEVQTTEIAMIEPIYTEVIYDWVTEDWYTSRDKPNPRCPTLDPNIPSPCADMCAGDRSCPEGKVCCRNNCGGTECMDPTSEDVSATDETPTTTEPPKEVEERPVIVDPQTTQERWESDYFDWLGDHTKMNPRCPSLNPFTKGVCAFTCGFCYEGKVCCLNNCGGTECMDPVNEEEPAGNEKEKFFWDLYAKNTIHQYQKDIENEI